MKNKVSIIIPYYKKINFIGETLKSIFAQTYKNFEVILIYDDPARSDLKKLKEKIGKKKIKLLMNRYNIGAGLSRNKGALNAKGKYLAFIDADDIWDKNKLKFQLKFMNQNDLNFSFTTYSIFKKKKIRAN